MSMKEPVGAEFTRMLDATVGALRSAGAQPQDEETARLRRIGESAQGQVRAEFGADGRLQSLALGPRMMRLGSVELCDHVVTAVNAAIDSMRGDAAAPAVGDLSQLTEDLEEVRDTAVPRLGAFLQALTDAQQRMAGGGPR